MLNGAEKNSYAKNLKRLVSVYQSMLYCFEDEDIIKDFKVICNNIVDRMEQKALTSTGKVNNEASAKQ